MKNLMKAFGIAVLFSGVVAVANAQTTPAQTAPKTTTPPAKTTTPAKADKVVGTDAKGNKVYKGATGNYWIDAKGAHQPVPKGDKVTPISTTPSKSK
jgi:hypothetical protein